MAITASKTEWLRLERVEASDMWAAWSLAPWANCVFPTETEGVYTVGQTKPQTEKQEI
jgi:hypothetical protein